ncbi:MAG: SRPBCC family protein [Gemmatimonadota bacterium]
MFVTIETSITINASPETVWDYASAPENWTASNPEAHFGLQYDTPDNLPAEGATFHQRESVAGRYADLHGRFHVMDRPHLAVWSGTALYHVLGGLIRVPIAEGGVLRTVPTDHGVRLSHDVYLDFPETFVGRWLLRNFERANGRQAVYDHTFRELRFFKQVLESDS